MLTIIPKVQSLQINPQDSVHDFLNTYRAYTSSAFVPRLYSAWAGIMAISSILSHQVWITRDFYRIYPNLYVMMIGKPGTGKGTSAYILKEILNAASFSKYAPDRTTKEKFLLDLEQGFEFSHTSSAGTDGTLDSYFSSAGESEPRLCSDVLILAEEFNDFMGSDNIDFITLLTALWSYSGTYRQRIKTGRSVAIPRPCINLFGGNTHEGFAMAFPSKLLGQGFLARFILVYGSISGTEEIAFPKSPRVGGAGLLGGKLLEIQRDLTGEIPFSQSGRVGAEQVIRYYKGPEDGRFENYRTRRFVQFLKLCICFAASSGEKEVSERTVVRANTLLYATEGEMGKALGEFGKSRNSETANKIMQFLYAAHHPVSVKQLMKLTSNDVNKPSELSDILANLLGAEKIQFVKSISGREGGYLPRQDVKIVDTQRDEQEAKRWIDAEWYNYLRGMG